MAEIGVRELKARASEIVKSVREEGARYLVTYRGKAVGVLMPLENVGAETSPQEMMAWKQLVELGEKIGREWQSPVSSTELLSEMRR
jgi:prevent-host-death family protein